MANLPPKPEPAPKPRDDRRPLDDRDRDHRAAVPMGPARPARPLPERERLYVPSRTDRYIPGGNRREGDRRDYDSRDRDRERFRDFDRDKERRRDYDRSPRKWESDKERHPYDRDRGSYRRPVSPIRRYGPGPSRRDSRSPPRRRGYRSRSRSPVHRSRRSRSPSPRRSPSKRIRLESHSARDGTRSRSPRRKSRSRNRSKSIDKRPAISAVPPTNTQQRQTPNADAPVTKKDEEIVKLNEEISPVKSEDKPAEIPSSGPDATQQQLGSSTLHEESKLSIPLDPSNPNPDDKVPSHPSIKLEEVKPDISVSTDPPTLTESTIPAIKVETTVDVEVKKMDIDSPKLTPVNSNNPTRSPSPHSSQNLTPQQRPSIPTGPERPPPRGPRLHPRSNAPPPPNQLPYPPGRRDSRRPFPLPGQPSFPVSLPKVDTEIKLPSIPTYEKVKGWETDFASWETESSKQRQNRLPHIQQDNNHLQALQRALHELHMATIDLHAAEGRRRVADFQLDRAKTGSLGIDAPDPVEIS